LGLERGISRSEHTPRAPDHLGWCIGAGPRLRAGHGRARGSTRRPAGARWGIACREAAAASSFGGTGAASWSDPRRFVLGRAVAPCRCAAATRQGRSRSRPFQVGRQRRLGRARREDAATATGESDSARERRARVDVGPRPPRRAPAAPRTSRLHAQGDRADHRSRAWPGSFIVELAKMQWECTACDWSRPRSIRAGWTQPTHNGRCDTPRGPPTSARPP